MKLLIDTNILIFDSIEDAEKHEEAAKIIDDAETLYIPSIVVHEFIWIMLRKIKADSDFVRRKVIEYLEEDPRSKYILESPWIIENALRALKKDGKNPELINDYIIMMIASDLGLALATYDRELREIAQVYGVKTIP
ncbi:MAG: PIN domain-containing protein [Thermoproteota archaeon]|nr:PIN domain-containing protein [Candidatus Brockarchaeota archaeon]